MPLTQAQIADCAAAVAGHIFGGYPRQIGGATILTAGLNWTDLQNAVSALDAAFDTTLNAAAGSVGGTTTIINALAASIPAPASGGTAQQKTILACYVLLKRAGLI